jgi:carboxypeptidase C (cathepsin A)
VNGLKVHKLEPTIDHPMEHNLIEGFVSPRSARRFPTPIFMILLLFQMGMAHSHPLDSARPDAGTEVMITRHTIQVDSTPLAYTARAGFIPLPDEVTGEVRAKIFFVSYTVQPTRGMPARSLTFYTAGGPVEPATLEDLGPRSLKNVTLEGQLPPPPYAMVDNQQTWLPMTDLVLIDPVGTGYSHATKPEYATHYYNRDADAESIAQFIQLYLQRYESSRRQPLFVAGTSYGSIRSALIADIANRRGIPLRGLILTSSGLANQPRQPRPNPRKEQLPFELSDLSYIQLLPTFTATAFFHKKLSTDLERALHQTLAQAEAWAADLYPKVLEQAGVFTPEQLHAAAVTMARLTGLSPEVILEHHFRFMPDAFLRELLGAKWTPLGLVDSRILDGDPAPSAADPNWAPVLASVYLTGELQFRSKTPYESGALVGLVGWHCGGKNDCTAAPDAFARLQRAMRANPALRVMITNGYYDLDCPYFGTTLAIRQLEPSLRKRVKVTDYESGHFTPPLEHRAAVAGFIQSAGQPLNTTIGFQPGTVTRSYSQGLQQPGP